MKECLKLNQSPSHTDHSSLHASWLSNCLSVHTHSHNPRCYVLNCFSRESHWAGSSWWGSWGRTRGLWEPVRVAWRTGSTQGLYGKMEEVFRGTSPLKKLFKGPHRFLKQLLQRVDPLPVSALSFNNNTIAEETEIKNDFFHYLKFWM